MVAVAILGMAIFGIFNAYSVGFMGMVDARNVTVATNYAREKMEEIKNTPFDEVYGESLGDIPGQTKFERKLTVIVYDSIDDLKKATTVVRWVDRNEQIKTVILETLIYNND